MSVRRAIVAFTLDAEGQKEVEQHSTAKGKVPKALDIPLHAAKPFVLSKICEQLHFFH